MTNAVHKVGAGQTSRHATYRTPCGLSGYADLCTRRFVSASGVPFCGSPDDAEVTCAACRRAIKGEWE